MLLLSFFMAIFVVGFVVGGVGCKFAPKNLQYVKEGPLWRIMWQPLP